MTRVVAARGVQTPLLGVLAGLEDSNVNLAALKPELELEFARERELHAQVAQHSPGLIPKTRSLRREQEELRRWVESLVVLGELGLAPVESFARERSRILRRIRRHLCAEADLLLETYMRDVGGD